MSFNPLSIRIAFILTIASFALASRRARCDDWPLFRHDTARTGASSEAFDGALSPLWVATIGEKWIVSSPAVVDGVAYVGTVDSIAGAPSDREGSLWALDAETGATLWRYPEKGFIGPVYSSPAVTADGVFFSCRDGWFYRLSLDGKLIWKTRTGSLDSSSPALNGGFVFFTAGYPNLGTVMALDAETGAVIWSVSVGSQYDYGSPALDDSRLYLLLRDGYGVALDQKTGETVWREKVGQGAYMYAPAFASGGVFFASDQNADSAVMRDAETGASRWSFAYDATVSERIVSSPATNGETLAFVSGPSAQTLYSLDLQTGNSLWEREIGSASAMGFASSPALVGNRLFVGSCLPDGTGALSDVNLADGSLNARFAIPYGVVSSPAASGRRILFGDMGGNLRAYAAPLDPGDANADGSVDVRDAILILRASIGLTTLSSRQIDAADLSPSAGESQRERINALDAVALLRKIAGFYDNRRSLSNSSRAISH